ncbi:MAG: HAMP domain-containing sensor histidine kinase [Rhizobiaceae bacterium]
MKRMRQILRTTAVRLTLVYTLLFGLLAIGVVAYISHQTGAILLEQFQTTIDEEVNEIALLSRRGGVRRLIPLIESRSRRPGANLYLISDTSGRIIAGNVRNIDRSLLSKDGWRIPPFRYVGFDDDGRKHRAIAKVFTLPGDLRLLVGRDIGDAERFRNIVGKASTISLGVMVLVGLLLWFFVGRRALKHIDSVSQSSERIIAGDLSGRLPLSGSGDEFDRLSTSLNGLIARVEKLNTSVSTMSDSIAHDLKTPLTRLRNRAEAALGKPKKQAEEALQEVIQDADGLIKTFNALLMISQVESGARTTHFEKIDIVPIVRDVHELFEPSAEEIGAELSISVEPHAKIRGNRELIAQAMTNLLDNAFKYGATAKKPHFDLTLKVMGKTVQLTVNDNGEGISKEDRERVRDRFVRLDTSRNKPGSGLGLSLVDAVVRLHGGKMDLDDANPGLSVKISLPLSD